MKNQTDLIVMIVSGVVALAIAGTLYATKPQPMVVSQPAPIDVKAAALPEGDVKMATSLASGGPGGAPGGAPMGGRPGGGPSVVGDGGPIKGGRGGGAPGGSPSATPVGK